LFSLQLLARGPEQDFVDIDVFRLLIAKVTARTNDSAGIANEWYPRSNDPRRDLVAIVMTQSPDFLFSGGLEAFWRGVYAAVE